MTDSRTQAWVAAAIAALGTVACQKGEETTPAAQATAEETTTPSQEQGDADVSAGKPADADRPAKECCIGKNECKGKGGCAVEGKSSCAGKNECKGQGGCNMHCPK